MAQIGKPKRIIEIVPEPVKAPERKKAPAAPKKKEPVPA